jgi:hypothetical protein
MRSSPCSAVNPKKLEWELKQQRRLDDADVTAALRDQLVDLIAYEGELRSTLFTVPRGTRRHRRLVADRASIQRTISQLRTRIARREQGDPGPTRRAVRNVG